MVRFPFRLLDRLTDSVVDLEHLWDFSWFAVTGSIEGDHSELVFAASLQTADH